METTIAAVHAAMEAGDLTAEQLVQAYLDRIEAYDKQGPTINSIITVNPRALERARELDSALAVSGLVGPLHGVPVIVKDNYDTYDLPTTNGTLALKGAIPPDDAYQVRKIREAGAIILAKANLGLVGLGTDTGSSIRGPASHQALVGFRTTMGLSSRDGIAPLSATRDVGGPIARTVADAVAVLEVIAGYDPADSVTGASEGNIPDNYRQFLDSSGLVGIRIGVLRQLFEIEDAGQDEPRPSDPDRDTTQVEPRRVHPEVLRLMNQALRDMEAAGAVIVDPVEIVDMDEIRDDFPSIRRLRYDFERYLESRPEVRYKTLAEIVESGDYHPYLRYSLNRAKDIEDVPEEHPDYQKYLDTQRRLQEAVFAVMDEHNVDALLYPTFNYPPRLIGDLNTTHGANSGTLSPPTGFPAFNVPMGYSFGELPAGLQILGRPFGEPVLIRISYAYEPELRLRSSSRSRNDLC